MRITNKPLDGAPPRMTTPLIHIGYHKTGTTWLQDVVFNQSSLGYTSPWPRGEQIERIVLTKPLAYEPKPVRDWLNPELTAAQEKNLIPVLSVERFSGNPHSGGYDSTLIADRFAELLPNAKVLIITREQRAMIASCYKQHVRVGGVCSARTYLNPPILGRPRVPLFDPDFFKYDRLVAHYHSLFSAKTTSSFSLSSASSKTRRPSSSASQTSPAHPSRVRSHAKRRTSRSPPSHVHSNANSIATSSAMPSTPPHRSGTLASPGQYSASSSAPTAIRQSPSASGVKNACVAS